MYSYFTNKSQYMTVCYRKKNCIQDILRIGVASWLLVLKWVAIFERLGTTALLPSSEVRVCAIRADGEQPNNNSNCTNFHRHTQHSASQHRLVSSKFMVYVKHFSKVTLSSRFCLIRIPLIVLKLLTIEIVSTIYFKTLYNKI